jgi:hypothetical protein
MQFLDNQRWLVYVLPGFISLFVATFISDFPQIRDVQLPIVYVALTALSVVIPVGLLHIYGLLTRRSFVISGIEKRPGLVTAIFFTSIVLGFLFGIGHTTDVVSDNLRKFLGKNTILRSSMSPLRQQLLKLSYQKEFSEYDGQPNIESTQKESTGRYALVLFSNVEKAYEGVVHSYSGVSESPEVYLSPACEKTPQGVVPIKGPGVWVNLTNAKSIEIIYDVCSACAKEIEIAAGKSADFVCPFK